VEIDAELDPELSPLKEISKLARSVGAFPPKKKEVLYRFSSLTAGALVCF
jgi:hypothetical protein